MALIKKTQPAPKQAPDRSMMITGDITRAYLDSILVEERLIGAELADIRTVIFGREYSSPVMMPAFSHLPSYAEGRYTGLVEYSIAAKELNILNWIGMSDNETYGTIALTGADTVRIIKPYADHTKILDRIAFAEAHSAVAVGMDIDHTFGRNGGYDVVIGEQMGPQSKDDLKEYIASTKLPFIIKGVLSLRDAAACAELGVGGIVVSHHHGSMPYALPPLMILPQIVKELEGTGIEIFADCSIDTGSDVFKAVALGAKAVSVGRAMLPALQEGGTEGVKAKITQMNNELIRMLSFTGFRTPGEADATVLWKDGKPMA